MATKKRFTLKDVGEVRKGVPRVAKALLPLVVPMDTLTQDPNNAREHTKRTMDVLEWSLSQFGQQTPIVIQRDGTIIKGNGTFKAASAMGWHLIAAAVFEGDPEDARRYGLVDNKSSDLSTWDYDALQKHLQDVDIDIARAMGWDKHEIDAIIAAEFNPDAPDDTTTAAEAGDTGTAKRYQVDFTPDQHHAIEGALARAREEMPEVFLDLNDAAGITRIAALYRDGKLVFNEDA